MTKTVTHIGESWISEPKGCLGTVSFSFAELCLPLRCLHAQAGSVHKAEMIATHRSLWLKTYRRKVLSLLYFTSLGRPCLA